MRVRSLRPLIESEKLFSKPVGSRGVELCLNRRLGSVAMLAFLIVVSDVRDARACSCITGIPLCETLWNTRPR